MVRPLSMDLADVGREPAPSPDRALPSLPPPPPPSPPPRPAATELGGRDVGLLALSESIESYSTRRDCQAAGSKLSSGTPLSACQYTNLRYASAARVMPQADAHGMQERRMLVDAQDEPIP